MLDLTLMPDIEKSIIDSRLHPINCFTALPKMCDGYIEFIISNSLENIDLFNSFLHLELQVVKESPTGYIPIDDESVSPIAFLGATLFSQVEVKINNETISELNQNYHYQAYISTVCDLTKFAHKNQLSGAMALFDVPGTMFVLDPKTVADVNLPLLRRHEAVSKGKIFTLQTPILQDIFLVPRVLPCETEIRLKLYFNRPDFLLLCPTAGKFHLKLLNSKFYVQKYHLSDSALTSQRSLMKRSMLMYPTTFQRTKTFYAQKDENSFYRNIITSSVLPRRAFVVQIDRDNYDGQIGLNPFSFKHNYLSELCFIIDDKKYPLGIGYTPDFLNDNYGKDYFLFLKELNFKNQNLVFDTAFEWRSDYNIYCSQFAQDHSFGCPYITEPRRGSLDLKISWTEPLKKNIVIMVVLDFYRVLTIKNDRVEWKDI